MDSVQGCVGVRSCIGVRMRSASDVSVLHSYMRTGDPLFPNNLYQNHRFADTESVILGFFLFFAVIFRQ